MLVHQTTVQCDQCRRAIASGRDSIIARKAAKEKGYMRWGDTDICRDCQIRADRYGV